ncbi:MAG: T9SS type A sorting domain-containing protein [Chloroherpetonaceae bacterium]|nr:T9SS type A sorting domain-containing protein [Chloroherpetonaceae bacterium]
MRSGCQKGYNMVGNAPLSSTREPKSSKPQSFALFQNYPNPVNPSTTIRYALPTAAMVSLKVYDVLGREVATLVSERQAAGEYAVPFNATGLASGVYFYRLQAGSYVETKKMMLAK